MPEFSVGDKVTHRQLPSLGVLEVTGLGREQVWPDKGPVRKVYWKAIDPDNLAYQNGLKDWTWDFALEAW